MSLFKSVADLEPKTCFSVYNESNLDGIFYLLGETDQWCDSELYRLAMDINNATIRLFNKDTLVAELPFCLKMVR